MLRPGRDSGDVAGRVRRSLAEFFGYELDSWDAARPLREHPDIRYDSVTVLECVGVMEEEFGITIDLIEDDLVHTLQSPATIATLVARKLADLVALEAAR